MSAAANDSSSRGGETTRAEALAIVRFMKQNLIPGNMALPTMFQVLVKKDHNPISSVSKVELFRRMCLFVDADRHSDDKARRRGTMSGNNDVIKLVVSS